MMFKIDLNLYNKIIAFTVFSGISLYLQSYRYNLWIIGSILILAFLNRVHLFRNGRQIGILILFSISIVAFRAVSFSGKVLLVVFSNVYITKEGLFSGIYFLSQILMLFLLGQYIFRTTSNREFKALLLRLQESRWTLAQKMVPFFRMSWFILLQTPRYLSEFRSVARELRQKMKMKAGSLYSKIMLFRQALGDFVLKILQRSVDDYEKVVSGESADQCRAFRFNVAAFAKFSIFLVLFHLIGFHWRLF